jgi:glycosyltransferase involved in cell wall biosynthesis
MENKKTILPYFSIGIPVYNAEKHIEETIRAIQSQNFVDFEIICVDDGSNDNSLELLTSISQIDSRIKIYRNNENMGIAYTRKKICDIATGKFFLWVDADDYMLDGCLIRLYNYFKDENCCNNIVIQNADIFYNNRSHILYKLESGIYSTNYIQKRMIISNVFKSYPWTIVGKTEYFQSVNYPMDVKNYIDDQLVSFRYFDFAPNVFFMDSVNYRHFLYGESDSHSPLFYYRLYATYRYLSENNKLRDDALTVTLKAFADLNLGFYYAKTYKKTAERKYKRLFYSMIIEHKDSHRGHIMKKYLGKKEYLQYVCMKKMPYIFFEYYSRRELL